MDYPGQDWQTAIGQEEGGNHRGYREGKLPHYSLRHPRPP